MEPDWANKYIGIPFKWHGDTVEGCSCWGLVCLVQREVFGRVLPRHDEIETRAETGDASPLPFMGLGKSVPIDEVIPGDVLHMYGVCNKKLVPLHAGTIVKSGKVLHIEEGTNAIIEDYRSKRCAWRIIGAYRGE